MTANKPAIKMPELLLFARSLFVGFVGAEVWRINFMLGTKFAQTLTDVSPYTKASTILVVVLLCLLYAVKRGAHIAAVRIGRSFRIDLLVVVVIGIWINELVLPWMNNFHTALNNADHRWGIVVLLMLCTILFSPLVRQYWPRSNKLSPQLCFIADEEIGDESEDLLCIKTEAKSFAETVVASAAHPGLVFGIDGSWGVGKTSFINLAEQHWSSEEESPIVCRFESLRYASEPDLANRLIRDLSAAIRRQVFAPEFRPAVTRYSRLIKGKADVSFLGFKLSLEPSKETIDELLGDIDEVLKRIGRRVIIVIDDLDRLDSKAINNVLFATRQTCKLSQATYVLCYDTEVLAGTSEDDFRAREFLEKFVTVKLSLFVDISNIRDFLQRDWQRPDKKLGSVPSDRMVKLGTILNELAGILDGDLAANYSPFVGDMRKAKRFVNAMLLRRIEQINLGRTDFNSRDLINLVLLYLYYPGLFRRIYAEETEGRCGVFSVRREFGKHEFENSSKFSTLVKGQQEHAEFLLRQLFDIATLGLNDSGSIDGEVMASRACFNTPYSRNLEKYLMLIVRFAKPEPQETYVLYQKAVEQVKKGTSISSVLSSPDFQQEHAHDQFWMMLVEKSQDFTRDVAEDAINTLVEYLPRYSVVKDDDRGLRQRSIYSLLRLLDRVGWGVAPRYENTAENIVEIAWRVFGEETYEGKGLLERLVSSDRGILGWNDLMLFRLSCSQDRRGQLYNLFSALIVNQDANAPTGGQVVDLTLMGMRKLSQEVFSIFKRTYIDSQQNFYTEANESLDEDYLGGIIYQHEQQALRDDQTRKGEALLAQRISSARSTIKSFIIYQLSNALPPTGTGVGCGYYDESGERDGSGIAMLMNEYVFGVCFNPDVHENNTFHFLDHCLSHLSNSFFSGGNEKGHFATKTELPGGLDPKKMGQYWCQHQELIRQQVLQAKERVVVTYNYEASYCDYLDGVFNVLDELADDAAKDESTPE